MPDETPQAAEVHTGAESNTGKWILVLLAALYVAGSLYLLFDMHSRLDKLGKDQQASQAQIADLTKRMQSAEADAETLAHQVGMTKNTKRS